MSVNEIGEDILFADDESDTLFISAVRHDPETVEMIKNFPHMLGTEGDEFAVAPVVPDIGFADMDSLVFIEEETFDLDQVVAAASEAETLPAASFSIEESIPEIAENAVDLDIIFDAMQITATSHPDNLPASDAYTPATEEIASFDSAALPASVLDQLDPSAGIDDIFKKLVLADES